MEKTKENLLHYVWKHKLFPLAALTTTDGNPVEVIDPGLHNHDAGPDFFNAKVKIGQTMWAGNVELHLKASQWHQHGHDTDPAYDSVILHVVCEADRPAFNSRGEELCQMELPIPERLLSDYADLLREDRYPRCHKIIPTVDTFSVHSFLSSLLVERMERKADDILRRVSQMNGSWEDAYFQTLARNYGFGINSEAFEAWARSFRLSSVHHHRDDLFQIEAIFFGQAGMLDLAAMPERQRKEAEADEYFQRLSAEYRYLAHKFRFQPIDRKLWRLLRLRPQNFPQIRLSQLANLYFAHRSNIASLLDCSTLEEMLDALDTHATEYWQTHYSFGRESKRNEKQLSKTSRQLLVLNTAVPMLFAYGKYRGQEQLSERAMAILEQLPAEDNSVIRLWQECGLSVCSAADSQALLQLKREYCDRKECLRCRFGYKYLKSKTK